VNQGDQVDVGDISAGELHLQKDTFYRYSGSLTTSPYTEGVEWVVIEKAREASAGQIEKFFEKIHNEENAREIQPLNNRKVTKYVPY